MFSMVFPWFSYGFSMVRYLPPVAPDGFSSRTWWHQKAFHAIRDGLRDGINLASAVRKGELMVMNSYNWLVVSMEFNDWLVELNSPIKR
jgi:hypothetical protein